MDRNKAEYDILKMLVGTLCFSIIVGIIGVAFNKVDVQFVEGLLTGGVVALITSIFKDLSIKNDGAAVVSPQDTPKTGA